MKYSVSSLSACRAGHRRGSGRCAGQPCGSRRTSDSSTGGSIAQGPFGFEVGNAGAPLYGLQLGINLHPNVALVGNVGYADSQLEAGLPFIGGLSVADSKVLMYDGGLQLRLPVTTGRGTGFVPFVEGGVGAIRNEISTGPMRTTSTNVALIAGGGLDLQLTNALGAPPDGQGPCEPLRLR